MTAFWLLSMLMALLATGFALLPLLRRPRDAALRALEAERAALEAQAATGALDAAECAARISDVQARIAQRPTRASYRPTPALLVALTLGIPLAGLGGYALVGAPNAMDPVINEPVPKDMDSAIAQLAQRLRSQPDDLQGWMLLGRGYYSTQRFADARDAFARARELAPDDPDVLVAYAEALGLSRTPPSLEGEPMELIGRAAQLAPDHQGALWMLGVAALQQGDKTTARAHWMRLHALLEPGSPVATSVAEQIALLDPAAQAPGPVETDASTGTDSVDAVAAANGLSIEIELDKDLRASLSGNETVFVFARAPSGPRMPIAIERYSLTELPKTIRLDDADSMIEQMKLSGQREVVVGARISRSGDAMRQDGDIEVFSSTLSLPYAETVRLTLVRP